MNQSITLQLDVFEGPLDLLLYLIKKNDLQISQISLAQVTDQYVQYLDTLKELDIDVASEFLYMAAELTHLKSKTLLPHSDEDEEAPEEDMTQDIVARLREYERYKMAAQDLAQKPWLNRDIFAHAAFVSEDEIEKKEMVASDGEIFEVDSFELVKKFYEIISRIPKDQIQHHVVSERISVTERIYEILDQLKHCDSLLFSELFAGETQRVDMVVSFLALLEMAKLRMIRFFQTENFGPIRMQRRIEVGEEVLSNTQLTKDLDDYK